MGLVESYASLIVRRHCCVFWSTLVGSLLFGVAGGALLMLDGFGQGKLFAEESTYDWLVDGKPTVHQYDMVRLARAARPSEASGSAGGRTPLSQRATGNLTTTFMYRWRDGRDADLFSPAALQQMCEVENEILRGEHYGEVRATRCAEPPALWAGPLPPTPGRAPTRFALTTRTRPSTPRPAGPAAPSLASPRPLSSTCRGSREAAARACLPPND
jgi:hypothetical protein